MIRREHLWAALLFAVAVAVYLRPALFGGDALTPAANLYETFPWQGLAPPDQRTYFNDFLIDPSFQFVPWDLFARDTIRGGAIPTWNPYVLNGAPFLANAQVALFSPFQIPVWLLGFPYSLAVVGALKLWLAAFGAYLLARELRLGFAPAALAGAAYAFCAFNVVWLSHPHTFVTPMLPWALWLAERALARSDARAAAWLAAPITIAFLGGHPGTQAHFAVALALYVAVRALTLRTTLKRVAQVAGGGALGIAGAAFAVLPAALLVADSTGQVVREGEVLRAPIETLLTPLFPDLWGRPSETSLADFPSNYQERTLWVGAIALILAAVALTWRSRWRDTIAFAVIGAFGLLVGLGAEPFSTIVEHVPLLGDVRNARMIFLPQLGLAMLAAFGLQRVLDSERRPALIAAAVAVAVGLTATLIVGPSFGDLKSTAKHFFTGDDFPGRPDVIRMTTIAWWTLLAAGLAAAVVVRNRTATLAILAALVVLDIARFVNGYQPMGPRDKVLPPETAGLAAARSAARDGRIVGLGATLPPDTAMLYRLRDVRGYNPPDPPLRHSRLWEIAQPGKLEDGLNLDGLTPNAKRVLDVLGASAIIGQQNVSHPPLPGIEQVYAGPDAVVSANRTAAPRVYVPDRVVPVRSDEQGRDQLMAAGFDPQKHAVVQDAPARAGAGTAQVVADEFKRVALRAQLTRPGLVVLTESLRDGWSVTVDGKEADPVRVNTLMRGVVVPEGTHEIRWSYRPPGLLPGIAISLGAASLWALWLLRLRRRPD